MVFKMRKQTTVINLVVGGLYFCLSETDIERYPDSYFAHLLKDEWNTDKDSVVHLDRDGDAFRYIHRFMCTEEYDTDYMRLNCDLETLLTVRQEADFYNLPELVRLCNFHSVHSCIDICSDSLQISDFESFECVSEGAEAPIDRLVEAMAPLRPPYIATTYLNCLSNITPYATPINPEYIFHEKKLNDEPYHNCLSLALGSIVSSTDNDKLKASFSKWPFAANTICQIDYDFGVNPVFKFSTGGYCKERNIFQKFFREESSLLGVFVCIMNTAFTGGSVSTTVNGVTVTIDKPGECMAIAYGRSYSVDTVTSGTLVLLEFETHRGCLYSNAIKSTKDVEFPKWVVHNDHNVHSVSETVGDGVVAALHAGLETCNGVALCLTRNYTISLSCDANRRFETDPDTLTGMDASLYALLCTHFDVTVVTVYMCSDSTYRRVLRSCVLDFIPITDDTAEGTVEEAEQLHSAGSAVSFNSRVKIVAPQFGHGHRYDIYRQGASCAGTLLTALQVTRKGEA